MNSLFLILFTIAEFVLVILTSTGFKEKADWLKNRVFVRGIEAVILTAIILVPTVNMKWRFFAALLTVAFRFVFDGIMWLVKRNKISGKKKAGWSVVNCIVSVVLILVSLVPTYLFTNYNGLETTGDYKVGEVSAILVDESRTDPFETDGSFREVPVHIYYPENADGSFPLILFSHGAFGYYQSNYSTYAELVSNGYVVVALDHPHHSFFTEDTNGNLITVDMNFLNEVMNANDDGTDVSLEKSNEWLEIRVEDEGFVLDELKTAHNGKKLGKAWHTEQSDMILDVLSHTNTDKIGLIGHSLGGASSVTLGRNRDDIGAVIDLDGTMLGERKAVENNKYVYYEEPYPVPVLDVNNEKHFSYRKEFRDEYGYSYVNEYVTENAKESMTVSFKGSAHMDFTDLPLFSPVLAKNLGSGDIDHKNMMLKLNCIVLEWFDYYLKNEGTLDIKAEY